jgi:phosphoglycerate kinase
VLLRADLNVPLSAGHVADDHRITASLPTIHALREAGAAVIVCSHLGRPQGVDPRLSMAPVGARLAEIGGFALTKVDGVVGPAVEDALLNVSEGHVALLENTRFEAGETTNDPELADGLARLADRFVLDAFGSAHRAHASTVGVAERLPSAAGLLLHSEVGVLSRFLEGPDQPYVVVLGGAKISDKLPVMERLLPLVDLMLVGGGMCFTLLEAGGYQVGSSVVEHEMVDAVRSLLQADQGGKILLPADVVVADAFEAQTPHRTVAATAIPSGTMGLDVGPETVTTFASVIEGAATVFWNGPMGVFEWNSFRAGTTGVAQAVARSSGYTVVGGGDSVAALRSLGLDSRVSHVSTGGGAGLEMLQGKPLPGIEALRKWGNA